MHCKITPTNICHSQILLPRLFTFSATWKIHQKILDVGWFIFTFFFLSDLLVSICVVGKMRNFWSLLLYVCEIWRHQLRSSNTRAWKCQTNQIKSEMKMKKTMKRETQTKIFMRKQKCCYFFAISFWAMAHCQTHVLTTLHTDRKNGPNAIASDRFSKKIN